MLLAPTREAGEAPPEVRGRLKEVFASEIGPEEAVARIISDVRSMGDSALFDYSARIDGVGLDHLEVARSEVEAAHGALADDLRAALKTAAQEIEAFHRSQMRHAMSGFMEGGLGQVVRPLERVGIYVPGGSAPYPSTVLMSAIPARVAGVAQVFLATPPGHGGTVPAPTLVAADIAGVDRIFKVGGAQAIAALAYGTQSVPRVDKVVGPGGLFVTLAKRMVAGDVGIDMLAGPTETVIIADDGADVALCAADLLAQAEHDVLAQAFLITTSVELAHRVSAEVERQLGTLERGDTARRSLEERGGIMVVATMEQAIELVNVRAPEHLALMVHRASSYVDRIVNAGTIFIGEASAETLGDYVAGPSHVIPTAGTARYSSPLGVGHFLKSINVVSLSDDDVHRLGPAAAAIARAEGFTAHARAVEQRLEREGTGKKGRAGLAPGEGEADERS